MADNKDSDVVDIQGLPEAEDDTLDDFFAKKDRGKKGKKKKSKYITTEALAKTLEKISAGTEEEETKQQKKEKEGTKNTDGTKGLNNNDAEEWHEFEDESERDYSDLKIQNLQISKEKPVEVYVPQYDDEGELIPQKEAEGPWKSMAKDSNPNVVPESAPAKKSVVDTPPEQPVVTKSVYRPPHARLSGPTSATHGGIPPGTGRRRRQEAPVINSEIDFPSLASAVQDTEQHSGFETVKAGGKSVSRSQHQNMSQPAGLTLGNQFAALRD